MHMYMNLSVLYTYLYMCCRVLVLTVHVLYGVSANLCCRFLSLSPMSPASLWWPPHLRAPMDSSVGVAHRGSGFFSSSSTVQVIHPRSNAPVCCAVCVAHGYMLEVCG